MKYIVIICLSSFIACSVKKELFTDIDASMSSSYYTFVDDIKFLYKDRIYSKEELEDKYDIKSFKKIEVIKDKKVIYQLTKDNNCKAILKILY